MQGVFITGTNTEVGKTHIGVLLSQELAKHGITVVPRKPVESGCSRSGDDLIPGDAVALKQAANSSENINQICPFRFEHAISPVRAAHLAHCELSIEQLVNSCMEASEKGFLIVEGAGGFYSPLTENGLNADLAVALQLPVLLVADDRLGAINHVLLCVEAIKSRGLNLAGIVLNEVDDSKLLHMDNAADLRQLLNYPIFTQRHSTGDNAVLVKGLSDCVLNQNSQYSQFTATITKRA